MRGGFGAPEGRGAPGGGHGGWSLEEGGLGLWNDLVISRGTFGEEERGRSRGLGNGGRCCRAREGGYLPLSRRGLGCG